MPVALDEVLKGTAHNALVDQFFDMVKMDRINATYVAFTRAVEELYVLARVDKPTKTKKESAVPEGSVAQTLRDFAEECADPQVKDFLQTVESEEGAVEENREDEGDEERIPTVCSYRAGTPASSVASSGEDAAKKDEETATEEKRGENNDGKESDDSETETEKKLSDYSSYPTPEYLKYREDDIVTLPAYEDAEEVEADEPEEVEEEDNDPRSEGNVKHAVLERVAVAEDLPGAVRLLKVDGTLTAREAEDVENALAEALRQPEAGRWFLPGLKVLTERPVIGSDGHLRRPDRVVVFPDGHAEVVDYKFGAVESGKRYSRQVKRYVDMLKSTGCFPW